MSGSTPAAGSAWLGLGSSRVSRVDAGPWLRFRWHLATSTRREAAAAISGRLCFGGPQPLGSGRRIARWLILRGHQLYFDGRKGGHRASWPCLGESQNWQSRRLAIFLPGGAVFARWRSSRLWGEPWSRYGHFRGRRRRDCLLAGFPVRTVVHCNRWGRKLMPACGRRRGTSEALATGAVCTCLFARGCPGARPSETGWATRLPVRVRWTGVNLPRGIPGGRRRERDR